jgi:hypothetical protein
VIGVFVTHSTCTARVLSVFFFNLYGPQIKL